jgi:hypothetical protein
MKWWETMQRLSLHEAEEPDVEEAEEELAEELEGGGEEPSTGLTPDVLPEFLRGRSAEEIKAAIHQAFQGSQIANKELKELRRDLESLRGEKKPEAPAEPEKPLEELLYENPEEAIDRVIRKRYGDRFESLEGRVGSTVFATVKSEFDDFDEHEEEVKELISSSGAQPTRENILGAYQMVVGRKALEARQQAKRKSVNPERPKRKPETPAGPKLSDLEREIARGMGMTDEDYAAGRDNDYFDVKVPT